MIAATLAAPAAAVKVESPLALAMHCQWQRVTLAASPGRAAAGSRTSGCSPGSQGQAGTAPGRGRGPPARISVGPAPVTGPGSESPGRSARRRPGGDGHCDSDSSAVSRAGPGRPAGGILVTRWRRRPF